MALLRKDSTSQERVEGRLGYDYKEEEVFTPWLDSIPQDMVYDNAGERLHAEILAFEEYMNQSNEENVVIDYVKDMVKVLLEKSFRECQVCLFGSWATGLRIPGGDIDIAIESNEVSIGNARGMKNMLFRISRVLERSGWCECIQVNHRARVPIITFKTKQNCGSIKFDVGINNLNGLDTTKWVNKCLAKMPGLRPLVLVVKKALAERELNDASNNGISSFAVICMCVFFLQSNPYSLPDDLLADPFDSKSLGFVLLDFLGYYSGVFPYQTMYIESSTGRLMPKEKASWIKQAEYDRLVIQCPCDPERNLTKALSFENWKRIRSFFKDVYAVMAETTKWSRNILGNLVVVNTQFLRHRELMLQLYTTVPRSNAKRQQVQASSTEPEPAKRENRYAARNRNWLARKDKTNMV